MAMETIMSKYNDEWEDQEADVNDSYGDVEEFIKDFFSSKEPEAKFSEEFMTEDEKFGEELDRIYQNLAVAIDEFLEVGTVTDLLVFIVGRIDE